MCIGTLLDCILPKWVKIIITVIFLAVVALVTFVTLRATLSSATLPLVPKYFTPSDVVTHNIPPDCWVSFLGHVYDLTRLIKEFQDTELVKPILAFAGKDLSHWFREDGEILHHVHPITNTYVPYLPYGKIPHVGIVVPSSEWKPLFGRPWWMDESYRIGRLSCRTRPIVIINTLVSQEVYLEVCEEETIEAIRERYRPFNSLVDKYTWKYDGKTLDMSKTLSANGVEDDRDVLVECNLPESFYTPAILLYHSKFLKDFLDE